MNYRFLLLVAVLLLWASPALAKLTFGVSPAPGGAAVSEAGARALGDYLQQRLREPVETRTFKDEKTLHTWLQQFRMVDLAILSRDYVRRQPAGEFFPLVELQGSGAPALLVMRQGTGAAERAQIEKLLLGMTDDSAGRQVLQSLGASRVAALSGQVGGGSRPTAAAPSRSAPARPAPPAAEQAAAVQSAAPSRPLMPPPAPSLPSAASPLRVGVLGASAPAPATAAAYPATAPAPTVVRRPEPPLPVAAPTALAPAVTAPAPPAVEIPASRPVVAPAPQPVAAAPAAAVPQTVIEAPAPAPQPAVAVPAPAPAVPKPQPQSAPQVARLEPPKPAVPVAPPAPAPREALVPEPPKLRPAPVQPVATPGSRQVYIAPFVTVMVPGAFSEAAFDHFVDTLMTQGEKQGLEFIILKGGIDRVEKGWLASRSYLTGEIFGYVEDKGSSSTDIRTRSRIKLFPHGSDEPAIELESPAKVFFDHDYSTLDKERKKLAEQMAGELASQVLASLAAR